MSRNAESAARRRTAPRSIRTGLALATLATVLGACSDIYFDRRETLSFHAGDAVASNIAVQTIDPWPREAGNRQIAFNGERMQRAAERYRTNRTTPLMTTSTSSVQYQAASQGAGGAPAPGGASP